MQTLPFYVYAIFDLTVIAAIGLFYKAANYSKPFLMIISLWIIFQSILGLNDFYKINTAPPRFLLLTLPPLLFLLISLIIPVGRRFIDNLNIRTLTVLHTVRIPVEIVLYWLFLNKAIPGEMTFEGRNFDILSGLSAPLVWYVGFVKGRLNKPLLLIWNLICLGLLMNIVMIVMLSVVTKLVPLAPEQPKIAFVYFPFLLLPSCLVPLVLYAHVAAIRRLLKRNQLE
ncbi:hypothetical protein [Chitinophaga sp. 212800010-3]|uniref:hypothetical protein n=1 Tax=unclassified Chitinophaga TaxID=2619133 RepID=UPI002DEE81A5|nr:ABC transporter permease [Chitinophaga sp. 212800010-3]